VARRTWRATAQLADEHPHPDEKTQAGYDCDGEREAEETDGEGASVECQHGGRRR
jgi:hypothetical protein